MSKTAELATTKQSLDAIAQAPQNEKLIEKLILKQDLDSLSPNERVDYVKLYCDSLGLNILSKPVSIIPFQGKAILYINKNGFDQLSMIHGISTKIVEKGEIEEGLYAVTVRAEDRIGRFAEDMAVVDLNTTDRRGNVSMAKPDAIMKCISKARRRAVGSLIGVPSLEQAQQSLELQKQALALEPQISFSPSILPETSPPEQIPFDEYRFIIEENYKQFGWTKATFSELLQNEFGKNTFDASFSLDDIFKLNELLTQKSDNVSETTENDTIEVVPDF